MRSYTYLYYVCAQGTVAKMETPRRLSRSMQFITVVFFVSAGCSLFWALLNLTDSDFSQNLIGKVVCGSDEKLVEVKGPEYQQYNTETGNHQIVQDVNIFCEKSATDRRDVTSRMVLFMVANTIGGIILSGIILLLLWSIRSRQQRAQQLLKT